MEKNTLTSNSAYKSDTTILEDDNAQLTLDPKLQVYLAQVSQQSGCWSRFFPIPFERAAQKSWWDPTFDSEILEEQYKKSSFPYNRFKFRTALWYMVLVLVSWSIYFLTTGLLSDTNNWPIFCLIFVIIVIIFLIIYFYTYTESYENYMLHISFLVASLLCFTSLSFVILVLIKKEPLNYLLRYDISPVGHFSISIEILIVIYTLIPLKLYMAFVIGIFYSICFELLTLLLQTLPLNYGTVTIRILSHFSIHLIGLHILVMTNVRSRNTFMKVGQSLLVRQQLESEKKLKENMIHSLMPPSVANWLLNDDENFTKNEQRNSDSETNDIRSLFRPFNMNRMENVSILFADIVGFTKMSSNKNADELVEILNNLFQRFDLLCKFHNCEKISTLGDCYYCVSGCPEPRIDHAECCVEMGLSMIQAIMQFDKEKNEGVNMRVGVHTGTVLCGIVGTKRFKFDVWSNDVTLANCMESTGKPGMVHISEKTLQFLQNAYLVEEGNNYYDMKTYFIIKRKDDKSPSGCSDSIQEINNQSVHLFVSSPATSSPSSTLSQIRPRVLSYDPCDYLKPTYNPNMLSPDICKIKANSLPSILDTENDQDNKLIEKNNDIDDDDDDTSETIKTPTSTASYGRYSVKMKNWKIPKFLRKIDKENDKNNESHNINESQTTTTTTTINPSGYQQVPTIIEGVANGSTKNNNSISILPTQDYDDKDLFYYDQKDTIDVKSYISQSRSDISQYDYNPSDLNHFIRGGSYRSQYSKSPNDISFLQRAGSNRSKRGRSPNNCDLFPTQRDRSATVTIGNMDRLKRSFEGSERMTNFDDQFNMSQFNQNRKDSGIKSNSRRSSIQQIENHHILCSDMMQHRVSGYFTSSQSTVNTSHPYPSHTIPPAGVFFDKYGTCIKNLRKQSDRQLIKCVQDNSKSHCSYFIKPPLKKFTLFFRNKSLENDYRANVYSLSNRDLFLTLAHSKFNTYFDVFLSFIIFLIISICLLLLYGYSKLWLIIFCCFLFIQIFGFFYSFKKCINLSERYFSWIFLTHFYRWNMLGGILISLPIIFVLINLCNTNVLINSNYLYTYLLFISIIHFCNFTQLNCWMKNILLTLCIIIFISLFFNYTFFLFENFNNTNNYDDIKFYTLLYKFEIIMDLLLLLILVWMLNREFEIGYRLSFHANFVSNRDQIHVQSLKNQADYLIYNIVPEHVAEQLKKNAKYSENFKNVGIIFASIVNFNEMYDETYLGGKEFLRVLNELIGDFDELLDRNEFSTIEKIKTIGSTFMAASGLNSDMRLQQNDLNDHLYALMDFALEMQNVVNDFNRDLLEFNLILRVGYNFGDVTAAVIGNTKLYYDIWGDAVNIASRMDSTGINGHIQVGEHCLDILNKKYVFQPRGTIYVKGKDNMNVYLLHHKKTPNEIHSNSINNI